MDPRYLLPNFDYEVEGANLDETETQLWLSIKPRSQVALCPCCKTSTKRVHSHYKRVIQDVASSGRPVEITLNVRRFFCDNAVCQRRIFTRSEERRVGKECRSRLS